MKKDGFFAFLKGVRLAIQEMSIFHSPIVSSSYPLLVKLKASTSKVDFHSYSLNMEHYHGAQAKRTDNLVVIQNNSEMG